MHISRSFILNVTVAYLIFSSPYNYANRISKNPPGYPSGGVIPQPQDSSSSEFSGDITFVTDYVSYGTSNTNKLPAIQGTISYNHPSGFYVSVWGSNSIINGWKQSLELYPYVGWSWDNQDWSVYILGAYDAYFFRPAGMNPSYQEFEGAIAHNFSSMKIGVGLTYSPNYYDSSGQTFFPFFRLNIPLKKEYEFQMQLAYASIQNNIQYGVPNYGAIRLGIKKTNAFKELDVGFYIYNTSVKSSQCFPEGPNERPLVNACGPSAFFTISRQFA